MIHQNDCHLCTEKNNSFTKAKVCAVLLLIVVVISFLSGCISPGYHQRKIREAKGLPPLVMKPSSDQEREDFFNHIMRVNPAMPDPLE